MKFRTLLSLIALLTFPLHALAYDLQPGATQAVASTITSTSANSFVVGANGSTNPVFNVDASTASVATGFNIAGAAAASGLAAKVLSSGANENLTVDAKGTGTITLNGTATGNVISGTGLTSKHATAGLGYSTGAGGSVTQITNRSTGVTLNTATGKITMNSASLAALGVVTFTVTDSAVAATDTVVVNLQSGLTTGTPIPFVSTIAAGSFNISVYNAHAATADTTADVINFAVVKGVTS